MLPDRFRKFWNQPFYSEFFSRGHGLSLSQAGLLFGTLTGASGIIGTVIGGFGTDRAARRDPRWAMWLPCCALLLGAPLYIFAVWQRQLTLAFPLMILSSIAFYVWSPAANGSVQNMVEPRMRASAAALLSLLVNTLGTGCGPVFVGYLSDRYAQHLFAAGTFATECPGGIAASHAAAPLIQACQTAAAGSIRLAITTTAGVYVWAALHFLLASRSLVQDLRSRSTVPSAA